MSNPFTPPASRDPVRTEPSASTRVAALAAREMLLKMAKAMRPGGDGKVAGAPSGSWKKGTGAAFGGPPIQVAFGVGLAVVTVFFGLGGLWAATAELSSAAVAPGRVTVDTNRKTIQHLEGGIIRTLHVKDGDRVQAGDPLVTLDDAQARASWDVLHSQYIALRALEARLTAEQDGRPGITFPDDILETADRPEVRQVIEGQERLMETRQRALRTGRNILRQRIAQLRQEIASLRNQMEATDHQIALVAEEEETVRKLVKQGLERRPRQLVLERERARLQGMRDQQAGAIARAEQEIGEAELEILKLENEFHNEVATELRETQTRVADLRDRLAAAWDVLDRRVVTAPIAGTVVNMQYFTPGGVVGPGHPIMDIVPQDDTLIVEARLRPVDVDDVAEGLPAEVRLPAFKARTTPTLRGSVTYVSADSLTDERTGQHYYTARISIPADQLSLLKGRTLTPGMPADVLIVTGERTALEYMVAPITDSVRYAFREG